MTETGIVLTDGTSTAEAIAAISTERMTRIEALTIRELSIDGTSTVDASLIGSYNLGSLDEGEAAQERRCNARTRRVKDNIEFTRLDAYRQLLGVK